MKAKTKLWILNGFLTFLFAILTFINWKYCNLDGFLLWGSKGQADKLLLVCNNPNIIAWGFAGLILFISLIIVYINRNVDVS